MKRLAALVVALLAAPGWAQEADAPPPKRYPPPPIDSILLAKRVGSGFRPALPEGFKLLDFEAPEVLATIEARELVYAETDYFRLVSTVPPQKVAPETWPRIRETLQMLAPRYPQLKRGFPVLQGELLAHFFAVHMHRAMVDAWKTFGSDMGTYEQYLRDYKHGPYMRQKNKFEIYLFGNREAYLRFSDRFTGRLYRDGVRHRAPVTDVLVVLLPPPPGGARDLNGWVATVIHNWIHNVLMSEIKNSYVIPIWLDVGFAHWFERREGPHDCFCFDESGAPPRFASGDWLPRIHNLITTAKVPEFADFFDKTTLAQFDGVEHAISYSLVDYLIRERVAGLKPFCDIRREKPGTQREHFQEAWDESPSLFFEKWRAWAREHYTKKGRLALKDPPAVLR
ncbi:MAG: hypothetical protein JXQ29_09320 [Planctomycetes bacterium]|nr:hypothetical protein [Planctomycetota bacterium]